MAGLLVAGQAVCALGLASVIWFTAACLLGAALSARFAPELAQGKNATSQKRKVLERDWLRLLRQPAFVRVVLAAALGQIAPAKPLRFQHIRQQSEGTNRIQTFPKAEIARLKAEGLGASEIARTWGLVALVFIVRRPDDRL
jgi:hypothetical protein